MKRRKKRVTIEFPFSEAEFGQWLTLQGFLADILTRKRKATSISQFERERLSKVEKERLFSFIESLSAALHKAVITSEPGKLNESLECKPHFLHAFQGLMLRKLEDRNE